MSVKYFFTIFLFSGIFFFYSNGIIWQNDIEKAFSQAKKEKKLIMIDFYTDWCVWCKKLDNETYVDKKVIELSRNFVNMKLNPEKGSKEFELARRYNVEGYPAIVFVDSNGKMVNKISGFQPADRFSKSLEATLKITKIDDLKKSYSQGNINSGLELVEIYTISNNFEELVKIVDELEKSNKIPENKKEDIFMTTGIAYFQLYQYAEASKYFKKVMDLKSVEKYKDTYNSAYLYHYYALFMNGEKKKAIQEIEKIKSNNKLSTQWKDEFNNFYNWMKSNTK